jgi:hypothetical protein
MLPSVPLLPKQHSTRKQWHHSTATALTGSLLSAFFDLLTLLLLLLFCGCCCFLRRRSLCADTNLTWESDWLVSVCERALV